MCGGEEGCIQDFVGKHVGEKKLGRLTRRWEDNIKIDLKGTRCSSVDWFILLTIRYYFVVCTSVTLEAGQFLDPEDKL
jgi:hypothetical protein